MQFTNLLVPIKVKSNAKCKKLTFEGRCMALYEGAIVSKSVCNNCEIYKEDITLKNKIKRLFGKQIKLNYYAINTFNGDIILLHKYYNDTNWSYKICNIFGDPVTPPIISMMNYQNFKWYGRY